MSIRLPRWSRRARYSILFVIGLLLLPIFGFFVFGFLALWTADGSEESRPPRMLVQTLSTVDGAENDVSVLFGEADVAAFGLPPESRLELRQDSNPNGRQILQATVHFEAFFLESIDDANFTPGCFEEPVEFRNDDTSQIVLTIPDFCPAGGDSFILRVNGVANSDVQQGWRYPGDDGDQVNVVLDGNEESLN